MAVVLEEAMEECQEMTMTAQDLKDDEIRAAKRAIFKASWRCGGWGLKGHKRPLLLYQIIAVDTRR